jgi:hypothetical protein
MAIQSFAGPHALVEEIRGLRLRETDELADGRCSGAASSAESEIQREAYFGSVCQSSFLDVAGHSQVMSSQTKAYRCGAGREIA